METPQVPPHVGWPLLVILLLLVGIGSALAVLYAAHSDGGAQILEEYRAVPETRE